MKRHVHPALWIVLALTLVMSSTAWAEEVTYQEYTSIKLNKVVLTISPLRKTASLTVTNQRSGYEPIVWTINPESVATIDETTGVITPIAQNGRAVITATGSQSGKFARATLVVQTVQIKSMAFRKSSYIFSLNKSANMAKQLVIQPSNATNADVTWSSSRPESVSVDENGLITVHDDVATKITATSVSNPGRKAVCTVKGLSVRVAAITLDKSTVAADPGNSFTVTAKVTPSTATYKTVQWESSDESIASVDAHGKVTARKAGKVRITAATDNGRKKASLTLRVRGGTMKSIKLSAIGDVVLGGDKKRVPKADDPIKDGKTSYQRFKSYYDAKGASYFFANTQNVFTSDDITVANLECVLTDSTSAALKSVNLSGPPKYRTIAQQGGIDVACLANNHAFDFGLAGNRDMINNLSSVGIRSYGHGSGKTTVETVKGVKIGFAGFQTPANRNDVSKAIRALKRDQGCSIVVVSFHWGNSPEWSTTIYSEERSVARYAINSGADLVLGHHKHYISGIEQYKGKMIVYDLGNFISFIRHVTEEGKYVSKDSMIYQQRFNVFDDGYVECAQPNIIPCLNSKSLETFTGQPHIVTGTEASRILEKIKNKTASKDKELVQTISGY